MPLVKSGRDRQGKQYRKAAYSFFPKYRLDEAIGIEVERITGDESRSLEEARKLLLEAGRRALASLSQEFQESPEALVALTDEWKAFDSYISSLDPTQQFAKFVAGLPPDTRRKIKAATVHTHSRPVWLPVHPTNLSEAPAGVSGACATVYRCRYRCFEGHQDIT